MYTEQEVINIRYNQQEQLKSIIVNVRYLANHFMAVKFSEAGLGFKMAEEIIVRGYCAIYMAHMDESDFEEMLTNTLAYFATGLYDCEKISGIGLHSENFPVSAWQYTPETHNDAGGWFGIYTFKKINEAIKCAKMLKAIGAELEKLHNN
jgi:hypothetical protein